MLRQAESTSHAKLTRAHIDHLAEPFPLDASEAEVRKWAQLKLDTLPDIPATRVAVIHRLTDFQNVRDPEALVTRLVDGKVVPASGLPPLGRLLSVVSAPIEWTVRDLMQAGEVGLILGTGEAAKSTWLLYVLICIALGQPVLGRYEVRQGPVALFSGEDGIRRIQMRAKAICAGFGWKWEEVDAALFGLARAGVLLEDQAWSDHLLRELTDIQPAAIGFDPLRDLTLAREAANEEIQPAIRLFRSLAELDSEPTVAVVHHTGYTSGDRPAADHGRGWSSLSRAARYICNLSAEPKRDGQPLRVHVGISKNNDLGYREPFGFELSVSTREDSHVWETARLTYRRQDELRKSTAHAVMLDVICEKPGMTTNKMYGEVSKRMKVDPLNLKSVRNDLEDEDLIRFKSGTNRSKLWYPTETSK
jgi:hypothetical protein